MILLIRFNLWYGLRKGLIFFPIKSTGPEDQRIRVLLQYWSSGSFKDNGPLDQWEI